MKKVLLFVCLLTITTITTVFASDSFNIEFENYEGFNLLENDSFIENEVPVQDFLVNSVQLEEEIISNDIQTQADNQAPVAALKYTVLNPDSLINGNFTTETQIAWLWSYNGENFTYDPDGDAITDIKIGGIPNSAIIGTITGNLGFATQFSTPGQYQMTYQVQDSNGAWSNIVKFVINIEPADGNTRPVCNIVYTPKSLTTGQLMMISWKNSYDLDAGDSITAAGGMVIKDGVTNDLSKYLKTLTNTECTVAFDESGTYEIWMRVVDSHGAWSNWAIFTVEVTGVEFKNVTIKGFHDEKSEYVWWVNNNEAKNLIDSLNLVPCNDSVEFLLENAGSMDFPDDLPYKNVSDDLDISGYLVDDEGNPVANAKVQIDMPLTLGNGIRDYVTTNENGYFSYQLKGKDFWYKTGYYQNGQTFDYLAYGDITEKETTYIWYSKHKDIGTADLYATEISVSYNGAKYSEDVTAHVGYTRLNRIGHFMENPFDESGWGGK